MTDCKIISNKSIRLTFTIVVLLVLASCASTPPTVEKEIVVDPLRFAPLVNQYISADSTNMPALGSLLFVGSSSIQGWKSLQEDLSELEVLNRGMGGSHMSDLIFHMDHVVYPHAPSAIFVYEGDNDIASGKTPETVLNDYITFTTKVYSKWPELPIYFISIKPSIARIQHMENMARANALIKTHTESIDGQFYVDIFTPMLGEDGTPRPEIFGHDGLHMNELGYALWTEAIKRVLGVE